MLGAQWTFAELFTALTQASFWSGYACQVIVSWSAIAQLVSRESTRGHSIATCYIYTPLARFLFVAPEVAELVYPFEFDT
ncbi:hypothetical protein BGAL_0186g00260 [Botrytis galanthina]|uniref:Uncharacterized protein n=1 Tax=Botrytis galanthina TaxID=278940 RepID=A0A4S8QWD0_9HELO|nr:hypothetical protein BGAL_0186g00260 [Botrytis galanthina]